MLRTMPYRQAATALSVPCRTVRNWQRLSEKLLAYKGNKKTMNLPGAGRPTILPQADGLLAFMDARRTQECALTCSHMIAYLKPHHQSWVTQYMARQKTGHGYDHLLKLLQEFCHRNGYTHQQACRSKKVISDLESTRSEFANKFHNDYGSYNDNCVYNVDETGIQFDMPPRYIWSRSGGNAKLSAGEKHSFRMTAVLAERRDGKKMPIMFVIKGEPGGLIEQREFPTYPSDHFYAMQKKAWMDSSVWQQYLWFALAEEVEGKSVLVLINFECHVTKESVASAETIGMDVCALPPYATSHCQPLDVSIIAPFKRHIRDLWISEDLVQDGDEDEGWMSPKAQVKRITMIKRDIKAFDMITEDEVRSSFLKAIPEP
ncbi:Aste57867_12179 [Aphanomyces stellatus]|uniref:Aste57867_12179 protein n=1 Tax=Aphanomyces stellatus TaxID=120398 RepID=A0A485KUV7_9STRA|nr:hypothetical protein As57867_012134 [Aphanomyces stellatus]VFT89033.1 Aste57867_12179 [Aphanomyces stellatus]